MNADPISRLRRAFPQHQAAVRDLPGGDRAIEWPCTLLVDAVKVLMQTESALHLSAISALIDDGDLWLYYHFWTGSGMTLCVRCPDNRAPSITSLLPAADWYEREAHDLSGVCFDGRPDLAPLVLQPGLDLPPPLRSQGEKQ